MSRRPTAPAANDIGRPVPDSLSNITAYDLMAATVVAMVLGHIVSYFDVANFWWRLPDRILWPVFFIPLGYNVGRKLDLMLLFWAAAIVAEKQILMSPYFNVPLFPLPILVSIAFARIAVEPLMQFAVKSAWRFWGVVAILAVLGPASGEVAECGFLALLLAMGGWLLRNRDEVPLSTVNPREFFVALFVYYNCYMHFLYYQQAPLVQLAIVLAGNACIFYLLYGLRERVLASVRRRPQDMIEKICSFLGHKSLEIYAIHILLFYAAIFCVIR